MRQTLPLVLVLATLPAFAEQARQLDAHEHGVGTLNIAVDGNDVLMEFHAPGADIVGFEYAATSEEDVAAIDGALAVLGRPLDLFTVSGAAGCAVVQASAALEGGDMHEEGHDDHAGKEHDDHGHDDHGHDDHDDHADEGHGHEEHAHDEDHDEHAHEEHAHDEDHDEHASEASHTEFHAEYRLTCASPSAIDRMTFPYFDAFQNAREVEVQIVTGSGAQAFEVTRGAPALDLGGLF